MIIKQSGRWPDYDSPELHLLSDLLLMGKEWERSRDLPKGSTEAHFQAQVHSREVQDFWLQLDGRGQIWLKRSVQLLHAAMFFLVLALALIGAMRWRGAAQGGALWLLVLFWLISRCKSIFLDE